jgi:hypothetical protein
MSLVRVILIAIAVFFAFRFIRSLARLMMSPRTRKADGETVGSRKQSEPLEKPFRDATDASFEDLTGTGNREVHRDRPS